MLFKIKNGLRLFHI